MWWLISVLGDTSASRIPLPFLLGHADAAIITNPAPSSARCQFITKAKEINMTIRRAQRVSSIAAHTKRLSIFSA
jgi:hypothetical protein